MAVEAHYSGDLNTDHLNTGNIRIPNFLKFRFQMVGLCAIPRLTIQILDQYIVNKMASICPKFKWSGCLLFKYQTMWHPFLRFEYTLVRYSDPHSIIEFKIWLMSTLNTGNIKSLENFGYGYQMALPFKFPSGIKISSEYWFII